MTRVLDTFYANAVIAIVATAVLGALCVLIGLKTIAAFLFMILGMMIVLWDAHTDPHIPEAPSLT